MNQPQEQIEDILTAIRKANPELMELSFGCVIHKKGWAKPAMFLRMTRGGRFAYIRPDHMELKEKWIKDETEIISHEPHLEHLLRAMEEAATKVAEDGMTPETFTLGAQMFHTLRDKYWTYIKEHYDLTKSLRQNLETNTELREFIHSLLKV